MEKEKVEINNEVLHELTQKEINFNKLDVIIPNIPIEINKIIWEYTKPCDDCKKCCEACYYYCHSSCLRLVPHDIDDKRDVCCKFEFEREMKRYKSKRD